MLLRTCVSAMLSAALVVLAAPSHAADPVDLLFYTPHLAETDPTLQLRYRHTREGAIDAVLGPRVDQAILLRQEAAGDDFETVVTLDADGAGRQLDRFRGVPGNPILMVFLETIVTSISRATGGSPFYIRNRLKEAFANGSVTAGEAGDTIRLAPFADDRNRHRMGPFADLEIEMTLAKSRPGMFGALTARAQDAANPALLHYLEEVRYVEAN
ncbi:MAG: hypothetical protein AAFR17_00215 [Pseudomonadota bacterium]